jgi:hypothetical protein
MGMPGASGDAKAGVVAAAVPGVRVAALLNDSRGEASLLTEELLLDCAVGAADFLQAVIAKPIASINHSHFDFIMRQLLHK